MAVVERVNADGSVLISEGGTGFATFPAWETVYKRLQLHVYPITDSTDERIVPVSKQQQGTSLIVQNRRARHDYAIEDRYEAGIVLSGTEVKSLREGRASLAESFVSIDRRGEIWLEGANIPEYLNGTWNNHAPKRKRKLLLHAAQIAKLSRGIEAKGYTIVPLSLYFKDGRVKAEIALARGKKEYDKRQALREEQDKREALRIMRYANMRHR